MKRALNLTCFAIVLLVAPVAAQWRISPPRDVPRTAEGEVDLNAPAPRTADGKPDLSGLWRIGRDRRFQQDDGRAGPPTAQGSNLALGVPRTPYGFALMEAREKTYSRSNPRSHCLPMGIVQLHTLAMPAKYVQTPTELLILYEGNLERREIFTDGRAIPGNDPQPWWNGYSVGRWDGETLVVTTKHFRDEGWLDMTGAPLSDAATVTERFRRPTYGRLEIDITVDDPKVYRETFTVRAYQELLLNQEIIESVCHENNKFKR